MDEKLLRATLCEFAPVEELAEHMGYRRDQAAIDRKKVCGRCRKRGDCLITSKADVDGCRWFEEEGGSI